MQQRRLRLGDILDDYCPRERRVTNHAVVAMIGDDVKQTRCTTCDTEHEYKQARVPALRRKKDPVSAAFKEVLAGVSGDPTLGPASVPALVEPAPRIAPRVQMPSPADAQAVTAASDSGEPVSASPAQPDDSTASSPAMMASEPAAGEEDAVRVHRRLIRATLPRTDNVPIARPVPQFTMRQPTGGRGNKFRPAGSRGGQAMRSGSGRSGSPSGGGQRSGFGRAAGSGHPQGGKHGRHHEGARPPRGGQPARHGKKHSK